MKRDDKGRRISCILYTPGRTPSMVSAILSGGDKRIAMARMAEWQTHSSRHGLHLQAIILIALAEHVDG